MMRTMTWAVALLVGWIGAAFAQMGPMESKVVNGLPGEGAQVEMRVKIFSMTREQMQAFVAKHRTNSDLIPVSQFERASKENISGIVGQMDASDEACFVESGGGHAGSGSGGFACDDGSFRAYRAYESGAFVSVSDES